MENYRRLMALALILAMLIGIMPMVAAEEAAGVIPESIITEFADPSAQYRAGFRYELPGGQVDQEQVKREMQQIKAAGFAVVEITASGVTDYTTYGLDSAAWRETLKTIYSTCNELGLQADIHLSFNNGANLYVPGLEVTDEGVSKEIVEAHASVTGGVELAVGTAVPVPKAANASRKLVRAYAAEVTEVKTIQQIAPPVTTTNYDINNLPMVDVTFLNPDALVDITASVAYDAQTNTAALTAAVVPGAEGQNMAIIAIYEQGLSGTSKVGSEPARKMDYFSAAGTKAFTDYYDTKVFDDELRAMMKENGGDLFSDSYGANCNWTEGFLEIFKEAKGYDIGGYLPILLTDSFNFDGDLATKIRNDHKEVLTDLYCEHHLVGLTDWANSLGLKYRDQIVYSALRDMMTATMYVDIPETESLYFMDEIDNSLARTAPANLARKEMVSTELGALRGRTGEAHAVGGYSQTWEDIIIQANRSFAGGVSQMLLHTFPHLSSTTHSWPGYTAFGTTFSENWGPRLPAWKDAEAVADYMARAQVILRQGLSQRDVVIYKHNYDWARWSGEYVIDQTLTREGYTFDFINPAMMQHENAYVEDGVIDPEGGRYQALIIVSEQYPLMHYFARPEADMMPVDAALRIEEYAEAGIPIIVVGEAPSRVESLAESDDEVVAIFARMTEAGQITYVESEAGIAAALRALEIRPAADNNTECGVTTYLRVADGVRYYFLYNQGDFDSIRPNPYTGGEAVCDQIISFKGEGQPYLFDMWSGDVTPIADFTEEDGYVNVRVQLDVNESTIIVLGDVDPALHAVDNDNDVYYEDGHLVLNADAAGTYEVSLSNGMTKTVVVEDVAESVVPEAWSLTVESWTPANEFGVKGVDAAATAKTNIGPIALTELKTWNNIPELGETISGVGTYTTTFVIDGPADGAVLDLGDVFDTVSIRVNGQDVEHINQTSKVVDLGGLVKQGENTLEILSASTLRNAVRTVDTAYAYKTVQEYGLQGPVTITPYVTEAVVEVKAPITVNLTGETAVTVDAEELTYTVSVEGADELATATVTLAVDGLVDPVVEALNGFYIIASSYEDGILSAVIGNNAGISGDADILAVTLGTTGKVGEVQVALTEAILSAYEGTNSEIFVDAVLGEATVDTTVTYSVYDVNQDGTVNQLDITRAQRFFGTNDPICDLDGDGVGITDLILILNNYSK